MPKPLINKDGEARSLTRAEIRHAKPFAKVEPELARALRTRGPQKAPTKVATTIRLDPEVVAFFKAKGRGWQSRINDVLRAVVESAK